MASQVPNITLNNGKLMPQLGLGTWNVSRSHQINSILISFSSIHEIDFIADCFDFNGFVNVQCTGNMVNKSKR